MCLVSVVSSSPHWRHSCVGHNIDTGHSLDLVSCLQCLCWQYPLVTSLSLLSIIVSPSDHATTVNELCTWPLYANNQTEIESLFHDFAGICSLCLHSHILTSLAVEIRHISQSVTLIKHPAEQNLVFCDMKAKFLSAASDAGVTHSERRPNTLPSSSAWFDVSPAVWGEQWQWSGDDIIWTSSSLPHQSTCHHPTKHWLNLSHINTSPTHFSSQICLINAGLLHTTWHNSGNKNHFYISSTCLHKILKQ